MIMLNGSANDKKEQRIQADPPPLERAPKEKRAQQRIKVKPLRDKLLRIEKEIDKANEIQQELDQQLADSEIYSEANRDQLRELLFDQARNAQLQQELEGRWLAASELLEKADVPA